MAVNETPPFWFESPGLKSWLMWPLSWLYSKGAALKMHAKPSGSVGAPVLCIGNFVAGGGGKTPTALAMAAHIKKAGYKPGFLSRGYGGHISGPEQVALDTHNAHDVGDEPLLLARVAPTVISADRLSGAEKLVEIGCDFIIMDDGFQNPRLEKDYALVVVDSRRGIGNGFAMPAGPLRVELRDQLELTSSILIVGNEDGAIPVVRKAAKSGRPIYQAELRLLNKAKWKNKWLLAYAGIADPEKFYQSLRDVGADLAQMRSFGDHHVFTRDDVVELLDRAKLMEAQLVTTSKDFVRLMGMGEAAQRLAKASEVANVELTFESEYIPQMILEKTLSNFEKRQIKAEMPATKA